MLFAAVFLGLFFTAPGDTLPGGALEAVAKYEAERRTPGNAWAPAALWGGPSVALGPAVPNAPGARDSVWVSVSTSTAAWLAGGEEYRVRSVDRSGNRSPWSNYVVTVAGPDTVWTLTGSRTFDRWARAGAAVGFARAPGDTAAGARAEHFEQVQARERARLCSHFGFWALRGAPAPCP